MSASYHLILPMPAGRTGANTGVMSVFLVPRLQGTGKLFDWTRDWRNWPRVVNGTAPGPPATPGASAPALALSVGISVGGPFDFSANSGLGTGSGKWLTAAPSVEAWDAAFGTGPNSIPVDRFRPSLRTGGDRLAAMYDAGIMATKLRELHRTLALEYPDAPPPVGDLRLIPGYSDIVNSGALDDYDVFMAPLGDGDVTGEQTPEDADFHQALAYVSAHPQLLRLLGLVVDLEVNIPSVAAGEFRLVVRSNFENFYPLGKTVPVEIDVAPDFWPTTVSGEGPGRWATIGDNTHRVESLDIDAGVAGLSGMADSADDTAPTSPAPLQTAGLYVTRSPDDLTGELVARWQEQADFEQLVSDYLRTGTPSTVEADGEILVAGRRYDVFDEEAGRWFSLWEREAPDGFLFPRNPAIVSTPDGDEGWMTYTAFTEMGRKLIDPTGVPLDPPPDPNPNPDGPPPAGQPFKITPAPPRIDETVIRVSPVIFSWRGWSLAANPPARGFSGITGPVDRDANEPTTNMPAKVIVNYEVPDGVLPRLRYTHRYKFRARVVDLAGNSRAAEETHPGGETETPLIRFGRTSPIGPPIPIRRGPRSIPGWGDTTTTMVIKSEFEQPDSTVVPASRLLFPSQTDQFQCELHGFPTPDDALFRDQASYDMFVQRTASSVDAHTAPDPVTGELVSDPQGAWRPDVDYLVEPAAAGFALQNLPGSAAPVVSALDTTWPNGHAIGFEIRAGDDEPVAKAPSPTEPTVTAFVPKGVTRTIEASITASADLAPHWAALQDRPPAERGALRARFESGQHWMLSVAQPLELVHAVRRPLAIPAIRGGTPAAVRDLDSTQCSFLGTFDVDVKSTGRIEVTGVWTDPIDVAGIVARPTTKLLFTQRFDYGEAAQAGIDPTPFAIGDTKRHDAELTLEAFSRYARYFTERTTVRFTSADEELPLYPPPAPPAENSGIAEFNVAVTSGSIIGVAGTDFTIDAAVGTIRHRSAGALPLNTDIDVDFIRLPINRRSDEAGAGPFPVVIPNSGVPPVPLVDEVLPAFDRERYEEGGTFGVYHQGQTVRVWLRRPWFVTGNGELLGVLVGDGEDGPLNEIARDAMSPFGPRAAITVDDFTNAVEIRRDLTGTGVFNPASQIDVAGHRVQFDADRDQWFADITISTDLGYRPFVKLALVRFQPMSVQGAHVSEPVITEPIRVGATRSAEISRNGLDIEVRVSGYQLGNRITAQFQYADPDFADADLRWTDLGVPVELVPEPPQPFIDETLWVATLTPTVDDRSYRIVIEDAEQLTRQTSSGPEVVDSIAYIETIDVPGDWTAPPPDPPDAPAAVTATPRNQAVEVAWTAPANGGSAIQQYTVERREGAGSWGDPVVVAAPATMVLIGGLTNGVQYGFRVQASNAAGPGALSAEATATPAPTVPAQIGPVEALSGHRAALVRWPTPVDAGSPITGLRVERREGIGAWGNGVDLAATSTRYVARGLTNGTSYEFRVRASNALGNGPWSTPAQVTPDVMVPGRVRRVVAVTGAGIITVMWRAAADRGAPILRYRIDRRPVSGGAWGNSIVVDGSETSVDVVGLAPGSEWEFRVRAENSVGAGTWSSPVAVVVEVTGTVPSQVQGVAVEGGDGTLTVTWPEAADGGSPVLLYNVQRRQAGTLVWPLISVSVPGDQLVHRYAGLTNGVIYEVRVRAINVIGDGDWSVAVAGSPAP